MLRKLVLLGVAVVLACGFGAFAGSVTAPLSGPAHALAADGNGVGPSPTDATGQARACETHAANNGESNGNGYTCGPTFSVSVIGQNATDSTKCDLQFTGSGLLAGGAVTLVYALTPIFTYPVLDNLDPPTDMIVPSDGVLNDVGPNFPQQEIIFMVTAASGDVLTYDLTVAC